MQKKMDPQCHCEGAVGDCVNLNSHNTKTVYFLRSEAVRKDSIGEPRKPLALSEQKLALSVAEWVEGVAISLLRKLEIAST